MHRFLLGVVTLTLCSNVAAEGAPPQAAHYAPADSTVWRPQDQTPEQQNRSEIPQRPVSRQTQSAPPNPSAAQQPYPQEMRQQQYPAPYNAYDYQERYDSGYYAYPQPQPGYWQEQAYPAAPAYSSGYYPAQTYNYPYVYETAPAPQEYAVPEGYGYPQDMGYTQEYYRPAQPHIEPGYQDYTPPNYGPDYTTMPRYLTEPQPFGSQQSPYTEQEYGYPPSPQHADHANPYPRENNNEWRPDNPGQSPARPPQQQVNNGILVNGAPAVFRPWTPPDVGSEQGTAPE